MSTSDLTPTEAALLRQLPFYIEHNLVQQMLGVEQPCQQNPTDFTWQAIGRYYALVLKQEPMGFSEPDLKAIRLALAAGKFFNGVSYPLEWDGNDLAQLRNPQNVAIDLEKLIAGFSLQPSHNSPEMSLIGFTTHMETIKPNQLLKITKRSGIKEYGLWIFDDGQLKTAEICWDEDQELVFADGSQTGLFPLVKKKMNHPTLDSFVVRGEIWRRWETGRNCASPQDVQTDDGGQFSGIDCIATFVPDQLKDFRQLKAILGAISSWSAGQATVMEAVAEIVETWHNADPRGTDAKLDALSQEEKALLLLHGKLWHP